MDSDRDLITYFSFILQCIKTTKETPHLPAGHGEL
jgi:hypothetical protein